MKHTYKCKICGKIVLCYHILNGKPIHRYGYCIKCIPPGLSQKEIGEIVGKHMVSLSDKNKDNTFKCIKCNKIIRKSIGHRDNRTQRYKYCVECLPVGKHYMTAKSLHGKKLICKQCGEEYIFKSNSKVTKTRCIKCFNKRKRSANKRRAVELKGGKCQLCGYNKYDGALSFHHVDSNEKSYNLKGSVSWAKFESEINKCILLCFNCHQEVHGDVTKIPKRLIKKWVLRVIG